MPVNDKHPQVIKKQYEIRQMRDTLGGPSNVKRANSLYLPIPASMYANADKQPASGISIGSSDDKNKTDILENAPWRHPIPAYQAYLQRARFPDLTALIHRGLVGVATKKDPEIILPASIEYLRENATRDNKGLIELFRMMVSEVLAVGRITLLIDINETLGQCVIVPYQCETFINWKTVMISGEEKFSLTVMTEAEQDEDEFSHECEQVFRVCRLNAEIDGAVVQAYNTQTYDEDGTPEGAVVIPLLRGKTYPEIPIVVSGVTGTGIKNWTCPLVGVSDIAISIFQKDADMSNSEFITCNPMLVFSGVDGDDDELPDIIGSSVTWSLPNPDAKAYYVEPESSCLQHISTRIENLFKEAVQYGVSVLGSQSGGGEAADTVKMRQQGNSSNLRTIIQSCAEALKDALEICEKWEANSATASKKVVVNANVELAEMNMTPQEQTALLQSFLNNAISHETYLQRLLDSGVKLAGETIDGEIEKISTQAPNLDNDTTV